MKKLIKIIAVMILVITLNVVVLTNSVRATNEESVTIYSKGEFKRIIKYNGIAVKTTNAVYQKNGIEYPAYCLNRDLNGVGEYIEKYDVTIQGKIPDINLWKVIINGYPYKNLEQLGVENEGEAYIATKQAIYCYIYNRGTEGYSAVGDAGNRVINAINTILQNAKNSTENIGNYNLEILQSEKWEENGNYISKQYNLKSDINIIKFVVNLENQPEGCIVTDLENQEKSEFNSDEKFKILIPITSLANAGEFKIKIQTQMETKPVFYGKAPSDDLQDYALTGFVCEDINTELNQNYPQNQTEIIIEKKDSETKEVLKGAKFELLNEKKEIIQTVETNENGKIYIKQIMPGIYYIREIKAPEGYEIDNEMRKIEIKLNENKIIEIKNHKIIIEKEPIPEEEPKKEEIKPQEEPKEQESPKQEEIAKLPITGM